MVISCIVLLIIEQEVLSSAGYGSTVEYYKLQQPQKKKRFICFISPGEVLPKMAEVRRRIAWTPFEESALTRGFAKVPLHRLTSLFPSIFGPGRCYPSISRRAKAPIDDTWQSLFSPMFLSNPTQYGALSNSWAHILADPSLGETLKARSNTDLKDKWRNMQRAAAQGGLFFTIVGG
jgi:hypothetical protein